MEPDGMKNACTRKVFTRRASTKAISRSTGSSRSSEPFFASSSRRRARRPASGRMGPVSAVDPVARGSSPSGTTSAGHPGRSLLIGSQRTAAGDPPWSGRTGPADVVSARDGLALLLDLGGLAAQLAEVVQLGATHVTAGQHLDLLDDRGVHREGALDTDAEADLAHGEGLADAAALTADDDALEDLDAGAVALDDAHVHLDGVARPELGDVVAQRVGVEYVQGVHRGSPVLAVMSLRCGQQTPPAVRSGVLRSGGSSPSTARCVRSSSLLCHTFS